MKTFSGVYQEILTHLLSDNCVIERNKRTGSLIKAMRGGYSFRLDLSDNRLPVPGIRRVFPRTAAAEIAWFLSGQQSAAWLHKYTKIWEAFYETGSQIVKRAYGFRWRKEFGRDQITQAIEALNADSSSRRIYISAWNPAEDGLIEVNQKNVPCPVGFTLSVLNHELHSTLLLRSSDVFVGLPYDVMGHVILMHVLKNSLNFPVDMGIITVTLAHPHLYEAHFNMACDALEQDPISIGPPIPNRKDWSLKQVNEKPEDFVQDYYIQSKTVDWPSFNPKPEVII